ncbi:MAG TPA: hypothetical protein VN851_03620 [Thermoanaerobaculia bacterium]|nr:hypothetical protein [Thermoanaerobaculia bacterium]
MLLNYLDTAIGFVVVILMYSLVITILVQMVGVLLQLRGKALLRGVELLLLEVDPNLRGQAKVLADQVLRHPAIAESRKRLASALRPEELRLVVRSLVASNPAFKAALAQKEGQLLSKINDWFEPVMDRAGERFKMNTRWVTTVFAVILAFGLQFDSIGVFRKISTNAELRGRLVSMSDSVLETSKRELEAPATPATEQGLKDLNGRLEKLKTQLGETDLQLVPDPWRWSFYGQWRSLSGVILSAFLLGLGAPFWYGALRNLVGLRHVVDKKDDERKQAALAAKK